MTCLVSFIRGQERHRTTELITKTQNQEVGFKTVQNTAEGSVSESIPPSNVGCCFASFLTLPFMNHSETASSAVPLFHLRLTLDATDHADV